MVPHIMQFKMPARKMMYFRYFRKLSMPHDRKYFLATCCVELTALKTLFYIYF